MENDREPVPQEASELVPPERPPPTAVGAGTPEPEPHRREERWRHWGRMIRRQVAAVLDGFDAAIDTFVAEMRRHRRGG